MLIHPLTFSIYKNKLPEHAQDQGTNNSSFEQFIRSFLIFLIN